MKKIIAVLLLLAYPGSLAAHPAFVPVSGFYPVTLKPGWLVYRSLKSGLPSVRVETPHNEEPAINPEQKVEICLMSGIGLLVLSSFIFVAVIRQLRD